MRINCGICFEFLTCNADVSAGPCGHLLHTACLKKWFENQEETKKTCPICRKSCPARDLRRLFFSSGETDENNSQDSNRLANQVDSLSFDLKCAKEEAKKLQKILDDEEKKVKLQREEIRDLERCNLKLVNDLADAKGFIEILKAEKKKNELLSKQMSEMKSKLETFKTLEIAINGSAEDLALRLHEMGDYSQSAKDANMINMALKRELKKKSEYESSMRKEIGHKNRTICELKVDLEKKTKEVNIAQETVKSLSDGMKTLEDELENYKWKTHQLQDAIASPSADKKNSAINRLLHEHPPPINLTVLEEKEESPTSSKRGSMGDFFDLSCEDEPREPPTKKPYKSPQKKLLSAQLPRASSGLSGLLSSMASSGFQCKPLEPGKCEGLSFNGLGGHGKSEEFPKPLKKDFNVKRVPSLKPKGVSRPSSLRPKNSSQGRTIDKFFTLQTP